MSIGKTIRSTREDRGFTLAGLAREAEMTHGYLSRVENGKQIPAPEYVEALADVLEVDAGELIAERDKTDLARRGLDPEVAEIAVELNNLDPERRQPMVQALQGMLESAEDNEPTTEAPVFREGSAK